MSTRSRQTFRRIAGWLFLATMFAGSALITRASLPYFFGDELHEFIIEKLPLPHEELWLAALHVHVVAAAFAFPACLVLLSQRIVKRFPRVHRWLGRVTGAALLLALVPSGAVLAFSAKGGWPGTLGFLVSGALIAVAMARGIVLARSRDLVGHRRAVAHVVAQMSVAVTSRALLVGFDLAGLEPDTAYLVALWLPVVASALVAELLFHPRLRRNHEGRSRRPVLAAAV